MKHWLQSLGLAALLITMMEGAFSIFFFFATLFMWCQEKHIVWLVGFLSFVFGALTVFLRYHFFDDGDK